MNTQNRKVYNNNNRYCKSKNKMKKIPDSRNIFKLKNEDFRKRQNEYPKHK